ncbi:hypothetical protein OH491_11455 [Termitidicoccus mucosus]|uniref:Uncharacterized protein n=1 Tax=Termitidicoccus mucosus TaxID=1184151 RepID=A0A178IFC4_9BACT|nr:hypothetical protein AW736_15920 [Opitutaceae bacterium TSB47]
MSLNRIEQQLFDYIDTHPEEKRFWMDKTRATAAASPDEFSAAAALDGELRYYYMERAGVVPSLAELARAEPAARTSMRNLAEYLIRVWTPPRVKKRKSPA